MEENLRSMPNGQCSKPFSEAAKLRHSRRVDHDNGAGVEVVKLNLSQRIHQGLDFRSIERIEFSGLLPGIEVIMKYRLGANPDRQSCANKKVGINNYVEFRSQV